MVLFGLRLWKWGFIDVGLEVRLMVSFFVEVVFVSNVNVLMVVVVVVVNFFMIF